MRVGLALASLGRKGLSLRIPFIVLIGIKDVTATLGRGMEKDSFPYGFHAARAVDHLVLDGHPSLLGLLAVLGCPTVHLVNLIELVAGIIVVRFPDELLALGKE